MSKEKKFDLVCIFFDGDRILQEIQAKSLSLFINTEMINKIIFVFNEEKTDERSTYFEGTILRNLGALSEKHQLFFAEDIASSALEGSGWRTQQTLKLSIARFVTSELYYVLDAKNHFIRPVVDKDIFGPRGLPRSFWARPTGNLRECFIRTCAFFDIDSGPYLSSAMPATTPYMLYTDLVKDTIKYMERKEGVPLEEVFMKKNRYLTEFFSYFAYITKETKGAGEMYDFGRRTAVSLFTRWPVEEAVANEALKKLTEPAIFTFGLHRNRIPQLTEGQREIIINMWLKQGIAAHRKEAEGWLPR